jgi:hypothetical protein
MSIRKAFLLPLAFWLTLVPGSLARHQIELESTYLGDGWFRYQLRTVDDPFFWFFDVGLLTVPFEDRVEYGPVPSDWVVNTNVTDATGWQIAGDPPLGSQVRPYTRTFLVRSGHRSYKQQFGALVVMSLGIVGGYHGYATSINIVGYVNTTALVPSSEPADSSTNLLSTIQVINLPDVEILNLARDPTGTHGLTFSYGESSTLRLEGAFDLTRWTNIAYIYGDAGVTSWTTNVSLDPFGTYFRLALVAEGHVTNLPPLNGGPWEPSALAPSDLGFGSVKAPLSSRSAKVLRCVPTAEGLEVTLASQPGHRYDVSLLDKSGQPTQSQTVVASGDTTTVVFRMRSAVDWVLVTATDTTPMVLDLP